MKKTQTRIIIIITTVLIVAITTYLIKIFTDPLYKSYSDLPVHNVYQEINADQVLDLINSDETYVLIMAFPTCPWCQQLIPQLNQVAQDLKVKKIYYLDIYEMRNNQESPDHQIYLQLKAFATIALDQVNDRISAPTVIFVKNQGIVDYHRGTVSGHVLNDQKILPPLTESQITLLRITLTEKFDRFKNSD